VWSEAPKASRAAQGAKTKKTEAAKAAPKKNTPRGKSSTRSKVEKAKKSKSKNQQKQEKGPKKMNSQNKINDNSTAKRGRTPSFSMITFLLSLYLHMILDLLFPVLKRHHMRCRAFALSVHSFRRTTPKICDTSDFPK